MSKPRDDDAPVDPIDFLRRALRISKEDAAEVREDAARRDVNDSRLRDVEDTGGRSDHDSSSSRE